MKKLILLLIVVITASAFKSNKVQRDQQKSYVTLSGKITNAPENKFSIMNMQGYNKVIHLNADGTFSDTLSVKEGKYLIYDKKQSSGIYLKNGDEISFSYDANQFSNSIQFSGDNKDKNQFYVEATNIQNTYLGTEVASKSYAEFEVIYEDYKKAINELHARYKNLGAPFFEVENNQIAQIYKSLKSFYDSKQAVLEKLPKGSPSPTFNDYENYKGGTTSLDHFKGKYVYIDLWATWCGPCIAEIPALQEVEKDYHNKNIVFVSISVDDIKNEKTGQKSYASWKEMVSDKNLGGIQLLAPNALNSKFVVDYMVTGIPRFILVDPKGNIVSSDAPRPSSNELRELLESLNL